MQIFARLLLKVQLSWLDWLSALAMLLQGHATAAWLWIVSRRLCLGQDESRRVQSGPCQHSRSWLHYLGTTEIA